MKYAHASIETFLNDLKDKKAVPGGGSVAALTGALACGLLSMVCAYSKNDEKNGGFLRLIEKRAVKALEKLKKLMQEDIDSYEAFSLMMKKKDKNRSQIKKAILKILKPPLEMMRLMPPLMEDVEEAAKFAKLNIVSDAAASASLVIACFESSAVSVKINLKALNDKKLTCAMLKEISRCHKKLCYHKKRVISSTDKRLKLKRTF
ncbi:MAG: cyclodeaminase/cyclohydrolase family protein [Candidatus Omnitrophota bacterium]